MIALGQCALLAIATVELAIRLPLRAGISTILASSGRSAQVIRSPRISDHWKEKALLGYSARIAKASLGLAAISVLLALAVVVLVLALHYSGVSSRGLDILVSPKDLIAMGLLAIVYAVVRSRLGQLFL